MDTNEGSNRVLENSFNYWFFNENLSSCTWECMNVMNCFQFFFLKMDFPFKCHQSRIKTENEVTTRRWKYYKKLSEMDKRLIESKFWFVCILFHGLDFAFATIAYYLFRGFDILFHEMALQHGVSLENEVDLQIELAIKEV